MRRVSAGRKVWVVATAGMVGLALAAPGRAQDSAKTRSSPKASPKRADAKERASGVVLKVQKLAGGAENGSNAAGKEGHPDAARRATLRLTINTDAVWRDWARDQTQRADTSASKDAAKGKNSVATKGEPVEANSVLVVDVAAGSKVETRFRALDDESSKGDKTPDDVKSNRASRPVEFKADDLKPGLFVEVDFRHVSGRELAQTVTVIRPTASARK